MSRKVRKKEESIYRPAGKSMLQLRGRNNMPWLSVQVVGNEATEYTESSAVWGFVNRMAVELTF